MLMLVVTIIIAAVVSAFAGGLSTAKQAAPSVGMNIAIANSGDPLHSYIRFDVISASEPIPTKTLKITTSWTNATGVTGGNITEVGLNSPNCVDTYGGYSADLHQAPLGTGAGVSGSQAVFGSFNGNQWFGNYTLEPGTSMQESPEWSYDSSSLYTYTNEPAGDSDGMQAILGGNWYSLRPGDIVHVSIIQTTTGNSLVDKDVVVTPS